MTTEQRLDSIDTRLEQLVEATRQLAHSSEQQKQSIDRLAGIIIPMARTIESLSQTSVRLLDGAQRSAQASEAAAIVAQSNQNAIRDLIEELRRERQ